MFIGRRLQRYGPSCVTVEGLRESSSGNIVMLRCLSLARAAKEERRLFPRGSSNLPHTFHRLRPQRVHRRESRVSLLDILAGERDVSGCHGHGAVPHDVLQAECVSTGLEVEQREGVSAIVRADLRNTGFLAGGFQTVVPSPDRERRPCRRAEERRRFPFLGADAQELVNGGCRGVADRQGPGRSRLGYGGADVDGSPLNRHVGREKGKGLAGTNARVDLEHEQGEVAQSVPRVLWKCLKELPDIPSGRQCRDTKERKGAKAPQKAGAGWTVSRSKMQASRVPTSH